MTKLLVIKLLKKFQQGNYIGKMHSVLVSNSGFTKSAQRLAMANKVELINNFELRNIEKIFI